LPGEFFAEHKCYFGGGTLLALDFGEYRLSVDIDFLCSDIECYRELRKHYAQLPNTRIDDRKIATAVGSPPIKFEILYDNRITLRAPRSVAWCELPCLSLDDSIAEKLLANDDRWHDETVYSKDLVDLCIIVQSRDQIETAIRHIAETNATGYSEDSVRLSLARAIEKFGRRDDEGKPAPYQGKCFYQLDIQEGDRHCVVKGLDQLKEWTRPM
jgi:Nucleotidyl transferase AbiEii toxin, Type IV TA system